MRIIYKKIIDIIIFILLIVTIIPTVDSSKNNTNIVAIPSRSLPIIDVNWTQQQKLLAPDGTTMNSFGISVSLSGDTALIGACWDDDNGDCSGSAYVFIRTGTTWTQQQHLLASDGAELDYFGNSVSLNGDTALIGAMNDDTGKGSVYVFTRTDTTWIQQAKLLASDGEARELFGYEVSLEGDTALIGALEDDDNGVESGSAYIFTRAGTTWTQQQKLLSSDGSPSDYFGASVSLNGDTALIGTSGDDSAKGSAYVFTRTGTTWIQQAKLLASDGAEQDWFGDSVSLDEDTALIGAQFAHGNGSYYGCTYAFTRTGTTWTQQQKLLASDSSTTYGFGASVLIDGNTALIGAPQDDDNGFDTGSAYVFTRIGTTWIQQAKLLASDGAEQDWFGDSVSLDGKTALIGAPYDDDFTGAAYVFITTTENQSPIADFIWTPHYPTTGRTITFDASSSHDPDGTITLYEWDWDNDGVYEESQSFPTTMHSWTNIGSYPVTLRVIDYDTATATITKTVNVNEPGNFIIDITGGFGINLKIKNNGIVNVKDVPWWIHVEGGILRRINITVNGTIANIPAGGTISVGKLMLFGFGPITITVKVADEERTTRGFLFLFFVIVIK